MRFAQWQTMAWLKTRQRQRMVVDDDLAKLLADEAVQDEAADARREALAECMQKLGKEQRKLVAKRYEPNGSVNTMAKEAGMTPQRSKAVTAGAFSLARES
jgi:RNA polymerase sigma-70 factor (ECF subfamily)